MTRVSDHHKVKTAFIGGSIKLPPEWPVWVKTSQGAALLARQVYLSKRPCPVRGRVGGLGPSADIAVLLAIGAVL